MYKWRPNNKCFYVISELHSNYVSLDKIFSAIIPLRFHIGQEDQILFMGDYIDGKWDTYEVLDRLISIKQEYPDRSHFLMGDREHMLLSGLENQIEFQDWVTSGGAATVMQYASHANLKINPYTISFKEFKNIFPKHHLDFLTNLDKSFVYEDYIFNHGGLDINNIEIINSTSNLYKTLSINDVKHLNNISKNKIILSHNSLLSPYIMENILLLGENTGEEIFIYELESKSCMRIKANKSKLYTYKL